MIWPWSTDRIYCADTTELANLLDWFRDQSLSTMNKTEFQVIALIPSLGSIDYVRNGSSISGFYVDVPSRFIQERRAKLEPSLAVADILGRRA